VLGVFVFAALLAVTNMLRSARASFAAPDPQAQTDFIRQIPLRINDVAYSPTTHLLYVTVPSSVGAGGNSIKTIDPATGAITNSVYVGSEPNRLAFADNGTTLYTSLNGAFGIRKFDVSTQTPGLQFSLGIDPTFGRFIANDLAVAPGNPNLVAVARYYPSVSPPEAGVAVFDNGVQRPSTGPGHIAGSDFIAFSASASTLYGGGTSGGVRTMTIDANGVTVINTGAFSVGTRIKYDNGLIFSSTGQVINATSGNLLGTFSGATSNAFVSDSAVGRAYYLTTGQFGSPGPLTLRAYDINTFVPLGTLTIPNIQGTPTTLIRWGSNGLAFRTTANEFYIIQTSLIPSADPIPTPTATPSPTPTASPSPVPAFVRLLSLTTNDLILGAADQLLYVSVPSSVGAGGNSIKQIDPVAGSITSSFFVGSEPTKLAQADDGQTAYVFLNGAGAIRKVNLSTLTAGNQFPVGMDSFNGVYSASDLSVAPGNPNLVAVARTFPNISPTEAGVAVFDNGVQRTKTGPGHVDGPDYIAFESPTKLYGMGFYKGLSTMSVDATGVTVTGSVPFSSGNGMKLVNGMIYSTSGQVIETASGKLQGTFSLGSGFSATALAVDVPNNRIFFIASNFSSNPQIYAFNLTEFLPIGFVTIGGIAGTPTSLVRWGTNGLAFRTTNNQVFLLQSTLVNDSAPVPAATPTPSPTASPSPPYFPTFVRKVELQANDLIYNSPTQSLYASVASVQGAGGNTITKLDPSTGATIQSVFVGSEPNKIAPSDDGVTLHVSLDGAAAIRRFDIPTMTPGMQFSWGTTSQRPSDMAVMPGSPGTVATSDGSVGLGVAVYDNGVRRTNTSRGLAYGIGPIAFGSSAATIYGYDPFSSGFELVKFTVDASGVSHVRTTNNLLVGFGGAIKFANGFLYSSQGRICDPEALRLVGTLGTSTNSNTTIAVDTVLGRAFILTNTGSNIVLTAYDINTFLPLGSATVVQNVSGSPTSLVRWGANGLAFRVSSGFGPPGSSNPSAVYLVQSTLVSNAAPIPTGLQLSASAYNTFEGTGTLTVTVNRTGDVAAATTVDYATSDGTATAGTDYAATSGTLTFAAGEFNKTISIPIVNDPLYEGASETFTITLSNASGGALLSSPAAATVTISDNDSKPTVLMASSFNRSEGNAGATFTFPVTLSNPSVQTLTVDYTTADNTATAGSDYVATSGTLTFPPGSTTQNISVTVNGDTAVEPDESFFLRLSNATNASFISTTQSTVTLVNDDTAIQLFSATSSVNESSESITITVERSGVITGASTARVSTSDTAGLTNCGTNTGVASERCDYVTSIGTVSFAAGQSSKTFSVPLIDDVLVEGNETFTITLSNVTGGTLRGPTTATVTIVDNDTAPATSNPIDGVNFFVRQQYLDILGRQPDQTGFQNWVNTLSGCPNGGFGEPPTSDCDRLHVAAGFFQSDEFLNRGYWAFRFYMVAFNQRPTYAQFTQDMAQVGGPKSPAEEESSKVAFADAFVQRSQFMTNYASLSGQPLADALTTSAGLPAYKVTAGQTNGQILRAIAERQTSLDKFLTEGTVSILYFGFQRRDPDTIGYQNNVNTLNADPNNLRHMIFIFIYSTEYRGRFGPP
jgi:Calx-beta domain